MSSEKDYKPVLDDTTLIIAEVNCGVTG